MKMGKYFWENTSPAAITARDFATWPTNRGRLRPFSSPEDNRGTYQQAADRNHCQTSGPSWESAADTERIATKEQHADCNQIGHPKRKPRICQNHERNYDWNRRYDTQQQYPQSPHQVVLCESRIVGWLRRLTQLPPE